MSDRKDAKPPLSLDLVVRRIEEHSKKSDDHVIEAARLVSEARRRVEAGEAGLTTWYVWGKANINLAPSRLRELMRIGEAADPRKELERLRTLNNERQKKHRDEAAREMEPERKAVIAWAKHAELKQVRRFAEQIARSKNAAHPGSAIACGSRVADARPRHPTRSNQSGNPVSVPTGRGGASPTYQ